MLAYGTALFGIAWVVDRRGLSPRMARIAYPLSLAVYCSSWTFFGGVGTAAIAGAQLAGATTIIAVDLDDEKLATAQKFGATHTVNSKEQDPVAAVQELTGGHGADVVVDAVGVAATFQQAFEAGRRALIRCSPYDLPRDKFAQWRNIEVVFNPEGMVSW